MEYWVFISPHWKKFRSIKNIHGEVVKINPKTFDPNIEIFRFWPLFHCSNIPPFHGVDKKKLHLNLLWIHTVIEIQNCLLITMGWCFISRQRRQNMGRVSDFCPSIWCAKGRGRDNVNYNASIEGDDLLRMIGLSGMVHSYFRIFSGSGLLSFPKMARALPGEVPRALHETE